MLKTYLKKNPKKTNRYNTKIFNIRNFHVNKILYYINVCFTAMTQWMPGTFSRVNTYQTTGTTKINC